MVQAHRRFCAGRERRVPERAPEGWRSTSANRARAVPARVRYLLRWLLGPLLLLGILDQSITDARLQQRECGRRPRARASVPSIDSDFLATLSRVQ